MPFPEAMPKPTVSDRFTKIDLGSLLDLYDKNLETRKSVLHNIEVLRCIRGGLRIVTNENPVQP
jgi:hypothetical protein